MKFNDCLYFLGFYKIYKNNIRNDEWPETLDGAIFVNYLIILEQGIGSYRAEKVNKLCI